MADAATQVDIQRLREDIQRHTDDDNKRFGEVIAQLSEVNDSIGGFKEIHAAQVGAAKAIADLAAARGRKNTWIVSLIAAACTFLTICVQKHWLGL
jgi:hypothetical protein